MNTPLTDSEERWQIEVFKKYRKCGWTGICADFNFARRMERALREIEDHHGETDEWREIARKALSIDGKEEACPPKQLPC